MQITKRNAQSRASDRKVAAVDSKASNRRQYKAFLLRTLAEARTMADLAGTDTGMRFWACAIQPEIERQIAKLADVTPADVRQERTADPALATECDALRARIAVLETQERAARKLAASGEGWERAEAAEAKIAELTREIDGWKGLLAQANRRAGRSEAELARLQAGAEVDAAETGEPWSDAVPF